MRVSATLLLPLLLLAPSTARSEPDVFGLGDGHHGSLVVRDAGVVINPALPLAAPARAGDMELRLPSDTAGFAPGDLLLILQVQAEAPVADAGVAGPLDLGTAGVGRWEFARLASVAPGILSLTAPLLRGYPAPGSQVVRVPEYTEVHVQPGASLRAPAWDGGAGGVLAMLASGSLLNEGTIHADGMGFRGGAYAILASQPFGCSDPNQSAATGGARKGEGFASAVEDAPTHGNGRLANGGGGGNCHDSGGGGGGHIGMGGQGGYSVPGDNSRDVGGRGGAALTYPALERLIFGGGGGAGVGNGNAGVPAGSSGTAGGGILYVRADSVQGATGRFSANGLSAASSSNDGAGGGGAGGSVTVRTAGRLDCASLEASGGNGGNNAANAFHGTGGGGGGGQVLVQAASGTCPTAALTGQAGRAAAAFDGGTYGATPSPGTHAGHTGAVTLYDAGFAVPPVPVWLKPAEGTASTVLRPRLEGSAAPGSTVHVLLDGAPLGSTVAQDSGSFVLVPEVDLAPGEHEVRAAAERLGVRSVFSEPHPFAVRRDPLDLQVGCACTTPRSEKGVGLGSVLLLLLGASLWLHARRLQR